MIDKLLGYQAPFMAGLTVLPIGLIFFVAAVVLPEGDLAQVFGCGSVCVPIGLYLVWMMAAFVAHRPRGSQGSGRREDETVC